MKLSKNTQSPFIAPSLDSVQEKPNPIVHEMFLFFLLLSSSVVFVVNATSEPWTPEKEARAKASYCNSQKVVQEKLPEKYQVYYNKIQEMCKDNTSRIPDMEQYLKDNLSMDEQTEIHVIQDGKEAYCNFVLGLSQLYHRDGSESEDASKVTNADYILLKQDCKNPNKGVDAIIPTAQKLAKIYYHF